MRVILATGRGAACDVLTLAERPNPIPARGTVRVVVHASGVNPSDVKVRSGAQGPMPADRVAIHNDGAGIIDAVGDGVNPARIGERVWLYNVNRTADGSAQGSNGTCAEMVCVPDSSAVPLPDGISFSAAACLGVPAMTAHRAMTCGGPIGDKVVLVTGGAGAVGHQAIQIAKALGATVAATVSGAVKAEVARAAGADLVINYRTEDLATRLLDTYGPIDHIAEVDFAAHLPLYPRILKVGGTIGAYATATDLTPPYPFYPLAFRDIHVRPFVVYAMDKAAKQAAITDIGRLLAAGQLSPRIDRTFSLADTAAAHEAQEAGALVGNAVVEMGD
jgi:NADPH2:quinone reductase